jgi:hypothetical protein
VPQVIIDDIDADEHEANTKPVSSRRGNENGHVQVRNDYEMHAEYSPQHFTGNNVISLDENPQRAPLLGNRVNKLTNRVDVYYK